MTLLTAYQPTTRALYIRGCALVLLGGLCWSGTGVLVRLAQGSDAWQYLFYRSFGAALFFGLMSLRQGRGMPLRDFAALGPLGWFATLCVLVSSVTYIAALKLTTVASAAFLSASQPLLAGALAFLILGERLNRLCAAAVAVGFAGIAVMVGDDTGGGTLIGNALAFCSALSFGFYIICLRYGRARDFSPTMFVYALGVIVLSFCVLAAQGRSFAVPPLDAALALFNGFVFIGVGSALYIRGSVHVPAAGLAVLSQTEAVFGPFWVWLVVGERPGALTLAGGALILSGVVIMAVAGATRPPPNIAT